MIKYLFAVMGLLATINSFANEYIKLGGSLNQPSLLTDKLLGVGIQNKAFWIFDYQLEAGGFVHNTTELKPTLYFGPSIGVSIVNPIFYVKAFVGPSIVSQIDDRLSTPYEFHTDFEFGFKDDRGVGIGVGYTHFSNAGLQAPNLGRDFLFFKVTVP